MSFVCKVMEIMYKFFEEEVSLRVFVSRVYSYNVFGDVFGCEIF